MLTTNPFGQLAQFRKGTYDSGYVSIYQSFLLQTSMKYIGGDKD